MHDVEALAPEQAYQRQQPVDVQLSPATEANVADAGVDQ